MVYKSFRNMCLAITLAALLPAAASAGTLHSGHVAAPAARAGRINGTVQGPAGGALGGVRIFLHRVANGKVARAVRHLSVKSVHVKGAKPRITVHVAKPHAAHPLRQRVTHTGPRGHFGFARVRSGKFVLTARKPGFQPVTAVMGMAGGAHEITIKMLRVAKAQTHMLRKVTPAKTPAPARRGGPGRRGQPGAI